VSGQHLAPARPARRGKVLDEVSAAIPGDASRRERLASPAGMKRSEIPDRVDAIVGRSRYAAEKHQQFSFYPCGSGFPTAKNRGKMPLTQYLETNPSA
jgi:hypothetical protein